MEFLMSASTAAADALISATHPFAQHLLRVAELDARVPHREWTPVDGPLPALYISHGAPPTFEDAEWMRELHDWGRRLPRPRAVLIVSAHWESDSLGITSTQPTELVYDFGGFAPMYYGMRYDTPAAEALAKEFVSVLPATTTVHEHRNRGLDHGAWVPLKIMYPEADIPVLQVSMPTHDTTTLLGLGERLRPLREAGVLVIGSGFMTHGLPFVRPEHQQQPPDWSVEFDLWAADALRRGDVEELANFRTRAPGLRYSHPTVEHFTPLFVTLGAAPDATVSTAIEGFMLGLSRRSFEAA
jgi:4,5-DOPA dioxygenase extradiol